MDPRVHDSNSQPTKLEWTRLSKLVAWHSASRIIWQNGLRQTGIQQTGMWPVLASSLMHATKKQKKVWVFFCFEILLLIHNVAYLFI